MSSLIANDSPVWSQMIYAFKDNAIFQFFFFWTKGSGVVRIYVVLRKRGSQIMSLCPKRNSVPKWEIQVSTIVGVNIL